MDDRHLRAFSDAVYNRLGSAECEQSITTLRAEGWTIKPPPRYRVQSASGAVISVDFDCVIVDTWANNAPVVGADRDPAEAICDWLNEQMGDDA